MLVLCYFSILGILIFLPVTWKSISVLYDEGWLNFLNVSGAQRSYRRLFEELKSRMHRHGTCRGEEGKPLGHLLSLKWSSGVQSPKGKSQHLNSSGSVSPWRRTGGLVRCSWLIMVTWGMVRMTSWVTGAISNNVWVGVESPGKTPFYPPQ